MKVEYITQPDLQLGSIISDLLETNPAPSQVVFVSAFVGLKSVLRVKHQVIDLIARDSDVRFVVGIDFGGTSREVLEELLSWEIDVRIIKHRVPGHTFHPKLYAFLWEDCVTIIVGSNNLTDGGFFNNYECAVRITYSLPEDEGSYASTYSSLARFLDPVGPISYNLTKEFLQELIARSEIPSELEARYARQSRYKYKAVTKTKNKESLFGTEDFKAPPPLPAELLDRLIKDVRVRRKAARLKEKSSTVGKPYVTPPVDTTISDSVLPAAFYMTLPTLQGENIPGEGRIPLVAIELAKDFWGWDYEYTREVSPRSGKERVYWNWRPIWKIWSVEEPDRIFIQEVRMYMYENSSDFRFYVRPLVTAGGDLGDVVRIRRIGGPDAEYECILARKGTKEYDNWIAYCTQDVRNSPRKFGFA